MAARTNRTRTCPARASASARLSAVGLCAVRCRRPSRSWIVRRLTAASSASSSCVSWACFLSCRSTADDIPAYLEPFFAAKTASPPGVVCKASWAKRDIAAYGFLTVSMSGALPGSLLARPACGVSHWDPYGGRG